MAYDGRSKRPSLATVSVVPRSQTLQDADEAIDHYLAESAIDAALGLTNALERTYDHIARHPASGSERYAIELNLPGLRFLAATTLSLSCLLS